MMPDATQSTETGGIFGYVKKTSAQLYLNTVVFPMIEGVAKKENVSLEQQVSNMIKRGDTLGAYADKPEYKERIDGVFSHSSVRFLLTRFQSQLDTPEGVIRKSMPWWMDRIKETKPRLHDVIAGEPNGQEWLAQIFIDVIKLCKSYLN
jgi:hypothetical protein